MNDFISREAAIGFSDRVIERDDSDTNPVVVSFIAYRAFLRELPAADVVEVVRCRDCKEWVPGQIEATDNFIPPRCVWLNKPMHADDYCSNGDRKDGTE